MSSTKSSYQQLLNRYLEAPITQNEKNKSKIIRELLRNKEFDKLYEILPNEIARIINSKYRIIEFVNP